MGFFKRLFESLFERWRKKKTYSNSESSAVSNVLVSKQKIARDSTQVRIQPIQTIAINNADASVNKSSNETTVTSASNIIELDQYATIETKPTTINQFVLDTEDDEIEGFEEAFNAIILSEDQKKSTVLEENHKLPESNYDTTEIKELFANIAANYIRPLKEFISELRRGPARKEWVEICQPALLNLGRSAANMDLIEVTRGIEDLNSILVDVRKSPELNITGELRDKILVLYAKITDILPQTFRIDETEMQSDGIMVNVLLKQIPDMEKGTIDKLYQAGLTAFESYFIEGNRGDIAATAGISPFLTEKITQTFKQYKENTNTSSVELDRVALKVQLQSLTQDLRKFHEAYKQASLVEWTDSTAAETRRNCQQSRQHVQMEVNIILAKLQATYLIDEIQSLPFDNRIRRLQEFVNTLL